MTTLLIVDDSVVDQRLAGRLMEKQEGWSVLYAADGEEAMRTLAGEAVDIVVTDMDMPGMNGLGLVEAMQLQHPLVPVIIMTAKGSEEIAVRSLQRGAASYVPKRRLSQDLASTIVRVLSTTLGERDAVSLMASLEECRWSFALGNELGPLMALGDFLRNQMCALWNCHPTNCHQIETALTEALLNAREHGNLELDKELRDGDPEMYQQLAQQRMTRTPYSDRQIRIDVSIKPDEARFTIRDDGNGFDTQTQLARSGTDFLAEAYGRGLTLMQTFMDQMEFNGSGNEVTLLKRRSDQTCSLPMEPVSIDLAPKL